MPRNDPTIERNSPILVRAYHEALEQSLVPTTSMGISQAQHGKRWLINGRQTVTTTEVALYYYIENPTNNRRLHIEGLNLYVDQKVTIDLYDEPSVDVTTFNAGEFKNTRSSVTKDPPWNLYKGRDNNVTISDKGRSFISTYSSPGSKKDIGASVDGPGYIIDANSSALIEIALDSNNDTTIAANLYSHEEIPTPDLTDLSGSN